MRGGAREIDEKERGGRERERPLEPEQVRGNDKEKYLSKEGRKGERALYLPRLVRGGEANRYESEEEGKV